MEIASLSLPLFGNLPLHLWVCIQVSLDNGIKEQSSTLDMGCLCHLEDRVLIVAANHRAPQRLPGLQIGFDHLHGSLLVIGVLTLPEADIREVLLQHVAYLLVTLSSVMSALLQGSMYVTWNN